MWLPESTVVPSVVRLATSVPPRVKYTTLPDLSVSESRTVAEYLTAAVPVLTATADSSLSAESLLWAYTSGEAKVSVRPPPPERTVAYSVVSPE